LGHGWIMAFAIYGIFFNGLYQYSTYCGIFLANRGGFAFLHAVVLDVMYLDIFPGIVRRIKVYRMRNRERGNTLNIVQGSFGLRSIDSTKSLDAENPMREG